MRPDQWWRRYEREGVSGLSELRPFASDWNANPTDRFLTAVARHTTVAYALGPGSHPERMGWDVFIDAWAIPPEMVIDRVRQAGGTPDCPLADGSLFDQFDNSWGDTVHQISLVGASMVEVATVDRHAARRHMRIFPGPSRDAWCRDLAQLLGWPIPAVEFAHDALIHGLPPSI